MQSQPQRRERAAAELAAHCPNLRPAETVDGLSVGLMHLKDLLTSRIHEDVVRQFGIDSMVAPASLSQEITQIRRAGVEIDAFAAVVVDEEATRGGYVDCPGEWFLDWILQYLMSEGDEGALRECADPYRGLSDKARRLRFVSNIQHAMPASIRTPGVLSLLFPLGVRIVAVTAFGDAVRAQSLRAEQVELLPAIGECHECHGRVLDNGESCGNCGNPLWTFAWLRAD